MNCKLAGATGALIFSMIAAGCGGGGSAEGTSDAGDTLL